MALSRYGGVTGGKHVNEDFENINVALNNVALEMDTNKNDAQSSLTTHLNSTEAHRSSSITYQGTVPGATTVLQAIENHSNDSVKHVTQAEHDKLTGIQTGAEVNQNAFSTVNNLTATSKTDTVTFKGGTGITVSTNQTSKEVTVSATGEATPGAHGIDHTEHGADPVPNATSIEGGLMSAADKKAHNNMVDPPRAKYTTSTIKPLPYTTWTTPNWDTKNFDTNEFVSQVNNGEIVIMEAGTYLINANIAFTANPIGFRNIMITKNGDYLAYHTNNAKNDSGQVPVIRSSLSTMDHFEVGDIIKISAYQDAGVDQVVNINAFSTFSVVKVAGFS
ncbi:hypothetical protein D3C74_257010 [compost metagenome]